MEEQERKATRAINVEERSHYTMLANCLKPVLEEEWKMGAVFERLHEVSEELQKIVEDPVKVPDTEESLLMNHRPALSTTSSIESLRREGRFRRSSAKSFLNPIKNLSGKQVVVSKVEKQIATLLPGKKADVF